MRQKYEETPFACAAQSFASALPQRVEASDDDLSRVVIPGWRYDEIADAVLKMYEKADAHVMPLPVFDIANALGYATIPYRAYGARFLEVLLAASEDAFTMQFRGSAKPVILYNDRKIPTRINCSIMHEIGHNELGHFEHCSLAEKEAGYFAGLALCPLDLLEHYKIDTAQKVTQLFNVSGEFASNRLKTLVNRQHMSTSESSRRFRDAVVRRFRFRDAYQMDLFSSGDNGAKAAV